MPLLELNLSLNGHQSYTCTTIGFGKMIVHSSNLNLYAKMASRVVWCPVYSFGCLCSEIQLLIGEWL